MIHQRGGVMWGKVWGLWAKNKIWVGFLFVGEKAKVFLFTFMISLVPV